MLGDYFVHVDGVSTVSCNLYFDLMAFYTNEIQDQTHLSDPNPLNPLSNS